MVTQIEFTLNYFFERAGEKIPHERSKHELETLYLEETGRIFEDPDRAIRLLHKRGQLSKISKGIFEFRQLERSDRRGEFSDVAKATVMARQNFECVSCGSRVSDSELIVARRELSGDFSISNAIAICSRDLLTMRLAEGTVDSRNAMLKLFLNAVLSHGCNDKAAGHSGALILAMGECINKLDLKSMT